MLARLRTPSATSKQVSLIFVAVVLMALSTQLATREQVSTLEPSALPSAPHLGLLPLAFEPNAGQTDSSVRFAVHTTGGTLFFTPSEVVLSLYTSGDTKADASSH